MLANTLTLSREQPQSVSMLPPSADSGRKGEREDLPPLNLDFLSSTSPVSKGKIAPPIHLE